RGRPHEGIACALNFFARALFGARCIRFGIVPSLAGIGPSLAGARPAHSRARRAPKRARAKTKRARAFPLGMEPFPARARAKNSGMHRALLRAHSAFFGGATIPARDSTIPRRGGTIPKRGAGNRLGACPRPYDAGADAAVPRSTSGGRATSPWEA